MRSIEEGKEGLLLENASLLQRIAALEAELALRNSQGSYQELFDAVSDAILLIENQGGRILQANSAACVLYGYSRAELLALRNTALSAEPEQTRQTTQNTPLDIERVVTVPLRYHRKKDGTVFPVEITGRFFDHKQVPVHIAVIRDASQKRTMQSLLAQSDRLSMMGLVAASVSHEINNPLSYVFFNLDKACEELPHAVRSLRESRADAEQLAALDDIAEDLRDALEGVNRIREISGSLNAFSRGEEGKLEPIDVTKPILHALAMVSNEIRFRARLVKELGPVPLVLASEGRLAQVFLNLLLNAAQAIPDGNAARNRIQVRTWAEDGQVLVEVSDSGVGISAEHKQRVFEPFFTTKRLGKTSGLGLSICTNIVTSLGGSIDFTSDEGLGASFVVRLPALQDEKEPADVATGDEASRPATPGRILVVDDEEKIRVALKRLFGRRHEVIAAASGKEAQQILERDQSFDLLVFDLMMPEVSGVELHGWLAARDQILADRVVFLTGGAFTPEAASYLGKVQNQKIDKPFDIPALEKLADERVAAAKACKQ